ncbi:hypothetical protein F5Y18DRAFT_441885 [Xylariaceae sp. FL1019]|nr:hypothetical protein F5Y18DRAFT_441885 [Xylariaceae sp. FL1019]
MPPRRNRRPVGDKHTDKPYDRPNDDAENNPSNTQNNTQSDTQNGTQNNASDDRAHIVDAANAARAADAAEVANATASGTLPRGGTQRRRPLTGVVLCRRKTVKQPHEYSENRHTQRVRVRNAGINPYQKIVEQARSADLKAVAEMWRRYSNTDRFMDLDEKQRAKWLDEIEKDVMDSRRAKGIDYDSKVYQTNHIARPEEYPSPINPNAEEIGGDAPEAAGADRPGKSGEHVAPIPELMMAAQPLRIYLPEGMPFGRVEDLPDSPSDAPRAPRVPHTPGQNTQDDDQEYEGPVTKEQARGLLDVPAGYVQVNPDTPYVSKDDPALRELINRPPLTSWQLRRAPVARMHEPGSQHSLDDDVSHTGDNNNDNGSDDDDIVSQYPPSPYVGRPPVQHPRAPVMPARTSALSPAAPVHNDPPIHYDPRVPGQHLIHPSLRTQPVPADRRVPYPYPAPRPLHTLHRRQTPALSPRQPQPPALGSRQRPPPSMSHTELLERMNEMIRERDEENRRRDAEFDLLRQQLRASVQDNTMPIEPPETRQPEASVDYHDNSEPIPSIERPETAELDETAETSQNDESQHDTWDEMDSGDQDEDYEANEDYDDDDPYN